MVVVVLLYLDGPSFASCHRTRHPLLALHLPLLRPPPRIPPAPARRPLMGHEKQVIAKDKQEVELLLLVLRFKNQKDNDASIVQPQSPFSKLESTDVGDRTTMVTRITLMAVVVTIRPAAPPRPQARAALALLRFDIPVRSDNDSVVRHCPGTRKDHHHQCG